jgi:hypothetical protein
MRRSNDGQKKPVLDNDTLWPLASEHDPIYKESWTISTLHGPTAPSKKSELSRDGGATDDDEG